ncbi:DUF6517 family protein [Halalkalicoccus tibetensis]|uniref:DUF6517 family protein n=1 Tax=Halalkalicoccus tibetensis TaxID=175632 RepID=A0ABD5UZN2_9EURY
MSLSRRGLCTLVALAATGSAGCLDVLSGEPARFVAPPARVGEDVLEGTDYELERTETIEEQRTVEIAAGQTRDVEVVNRIAEYHKLIDMGPLGEARGAVFATLSTPAVEVLGRTFNPIEDADNREIADEAQTQYEEIDIGSEIDRRTVTVLGEQTELSKFEGEAAFGELGVDVFVHTGVVESDDEYVVVFGIYPRLLGGEEESIITLAEGVELED